jgi:hypothetical protein
VSPQYAGSFIADTVPPTLQAATLDLALGMLRLNFSEVRLDGCPLLMTGIGMSYPIEKDVRMSQQVSTCSGSTLPRSARTSVLLSQKTHVWCTLPKVVDTDTFDASRLSLIYFPVNGGTWLHNLTRESATFTRVGQDYASLGSVYASLGAGKRRRGHYAMLLSSREAEICS